METEPTIEERTEPAIRKTSNRKVRMQRTYSRKAGRKRTSNREAGAQSAKI